MKKMLTLLVMVMACQLAFCQTHNELLNKYKDTKGANYMEVTKEMFQVYLATVTDPKTKDILGRLKILKTLVISNPSETLRNQILNDVRKLEVRYNKLDEEQEDGKVALAYTLGDSNETLEAIVAIIIKESECQLVAMEGQLKISDLEDFSKLGDD